MLLDTYVHMLRKKLVVAFPTVTALHTVIKGQADFQVYD